MLRPWIIACALAACSSVEKPPGKAGSGHEHHEQLPGPSPAICDPSGCPLYCMRLASCEGAASCASECAARCGDGYFDDRDGPLMACVLGATGDACGALKHCCEVEFTSQLCARD